MDEKYIFTRSEFAKMLGMTPNAVRMKMRRGHFAEESKYINNKWMFKRPRRNQVVRPAPSRLSPVSRHKRQGYDNIRNPVTAEKFEERNDLMKLFKKWGHLSHKELDALVVLANKEKEKKLEEKIKKADEKIMRAFKAPYVIVDGKKRDALELAEEDRMKRRHDEDMRVESSHINRKVETEFY